MSRQGLVEALAAAAIVGVLSVEALGVPTAPVVTSLILLAAMLGTVEAWRRRRSE